MMRVGTRSPNARVHTLRICEKAGSFFYSVNRRSLAEEDWNVENRNKYYYEERTLLRTAL